MNEYVLITGASSGIGRQCAIEVSKQYNVILCGRNSAKLKETEKLCSDSHSILCFICDVSNIEQIEENLSNFIKDNNIIISSFVHSAGVSGMMPLRSLNYKFVLDVFNVNVFSFLFISKTICNKRINGKKPTSIILISSNISEMGAKAFVAYSGSKAGANGMMRSLSMELAPETRVNAISPGAIKTEMVNNMDIDSCIEERMKNTYPLGWGKVEYIANMVSFLISDKASWITGQNFTIDGGRTINLNG